VRQVFLKSIETTSGYLENARIAFSRNLNCIIGSRGTCKSTIVETIRFAFDCDPSIIASLVSKDPDRRGMLRQTLGSGSVKCEIEVVDGNEVTQFTLERELDGDARVFRNGIRDAIPRDLLDEIEIYSQSALQRIASADRQGLRLQLIDRPNRAVISAQKTQIMNAAANLKYIGAALRTITIDLERLRLLTRDLPQVRIDLAQTLDTRPKLPPTLQEQHELYLQRQRTLETLGDIQRLQQRLLSVLDDAAGSKEALQSIRARINRELAVHPDVPALLLDQLDGALKQVELARSTIENITTSESTALLSDEFERLNESYYRERQQQQVVSESLKKEDALRRRLAELESAERQLTQLQSQHDSLLEQRRALRAELADLRDRIFETRVTETDRINREFGDVILLTVQRAGLSLNYVRQVETLLAGSRLRDQDDIARGLATSLSPPDLLTAIEDADVSRVATLLNRDLGQITRVLTFLRDHPDLYDLEADLVEDSLDITMFDQGIPKAVEELSEGQRATALLPLILRGASCPLIIDQPEDDLDNSFIFEMLVKNIINLKQQRQLIFVTHNANIPVLGDADNLIVMHMETPVKAAHPRVGTLEDRKEDVLLILEGGKEAFEMRETRYRPLLK
jgi:hypothetical protein